MRWLATWRVRLRSLFRRHRLDDEMDAELQFHLEQQLAENLAAGMSAKEAARVARLRFGNVPLVREDARAARGWRGLDPLSQDLRYSLRMLRRYPAFTAAAVVTLALGIGVNTAMVTVVNALLRPLPVPHPEQLTVLAQIRGDNPRVWQRLSYPDYMDYKTSSDAFAEMTGWTQTPVIVTADQQSDLLMAAAVVGDYFSVLGVRPAVGRLISPTDGARGGSEPIVVLGYGYWQRRFEGDPSIVGKVVDVDGRRFTVIGVTPEGFQGNFLPLEVDAFVPLQLFRAEAQFADRDALLVRVIGRLAPTVTMRQAQVSLATISARLEQRYPATNAGRRVRAYPERLARPEPGNADQTLILVSFVLVLVGTVLLVACANVLGLFLARGLGRHKEMAVRTALGASRGQLIRASLVEALLICLLGSALGAVAGGALAASLPLPLDLGMDWRVFSYLGALLILATLMVGLLPAWRASRVDPREGLSDGRHTTSGARRPRTMTLLATAQVAFSVLLMVLAGLFVRSFQALESTDLGFEADHVLLASVDASAIGNDAVDIQRFYDWLHTRLLGVPGVERVAQASVVPFDASGSRAYVGRDVDDVPSSTRGLTAHVSLVTADYFTTIGTPLVQGRTFIERDDDPGWDVAVVNETMAAQLWPGEDALGQRFRTAADPESWTEVIGVVRDAPYRRDELNTTVQPRYFRSFGQAYAPTRTLHLNTQAIAPERLATTIQAEIRALAPTVPVYDVMALERFITESPNGFALTVVGVLVTGGTGALALFLALIGIYAVLSFAVGQRTHEIGIRMALGASPGTTFRWVLFQTVTIGAIGLGIGLGVAVAAGPVIGQFLYGVVPYDLPTMVVVVFAITAVLAAVGYVPARRAARMDPMTVLRAE
jgi:predicted permease